MKRILILLIGFALGVDSVNAEIALEDCFAAKTKETMMMLLNIAKARDKVALAKLIEEDQAVIVKPGLEVQVIERDGPFVRVRPIGFTFEVWMLAGAIK